MSSTAVPPVPNNVPGIPLLCLSPASEKEKEKKEKGGPGGFEAPPWRLGKEPFHAARMISLSGHPLTPAAEGLVGQLRATVEAWERGTAARQRGRRQISLEKLDRALGTILASLLPYWGGEPPRASYRSLHKEDFTGQPVGARVFRRVIRALQETGLIHHHPGRRSSARDSLAGRYWPTQQLLELAVGQGLTPESLYRHFRRETPTAIPRIVRPLRLMALKRRPGQGHAPALPFDPAAEEVRALAEEVEAMNRLAAATEVQGCRPPRWFRSFTQDWRHHGRWYAGGDDNYQQKPQDERLRITIGGEPVVEVDIRASHLTMLHALLGLPAPDGDPYAVGDVPREVAKAWINASLGKGSPVRRWAKKTLEQMQKQMPDLAAFPPRKVGEAILRRYPFLADPAAALAGNRPAGRDARQLLPHRLMFAEACVLSHALRQLAGQGILALPMHDGLIVPRPARQAAAEALRQAGLDIAGIRLALKVDGG